MIGTLMKIIMIFIVVCSLTLFLYMILLLIYQIKYILLNTTTSEEIRKVRKPIPDFNLGSKMLNWKQFNYNIDDYRKVIAYSDTAIDYLNKNISLSQIVDKSKRYRTNDSKVLTPLLEA